MFRTPPYLEKTAYISINLDTPLSFPGNNQTQKKRNHKFTVNDRNNFYDWYNAEAIANGANIGADTESAPINGSFSLIKSLNLKSVGKTLYAANNIHNIFSSKTCLTFRMIFREPRQKANFGILTLIPPQRLITMRLTRECGQGHF